MSTQKVFGRQIVFSGGGFFRLFPSFLIKRWAKQNPYLMSYFHPRDFDPGQPVMQTLPPIRRFKTYVGLKNAFSKFERFLDDFDFISVKEADKLIDWETVRKIEFSTN